MERLGVFEQFKQECVAGFVVGGIGFFLFAQSHAAAFLTPAHFVASFFQFVERDSFQPPTRSEERCFIDDIRELCAGITWRPPRHHLQVHALGQLHFFANAREEFPRDLSRRAN